MKRFAKAGGAGVVAFAGALIASGWYWSNFGVALGAGVAAGLAAYHLPYQAAPPKGN